MRSARGLTLVELLVAISILAVLSAIAFSVFSSVQMKFRDARRKSDLRTVAQALEIYYQKNGKYPCNFSYSYSSFGSTWVENTSPCKTGDSIILFDSTYLNTKPFDPKSNDLFFTTDVNKYGYGYYGAAPFLFWGCPSTITKGQIYVLFTRLENTSDPDRNELKRYKICNNYVIFDPVPAGNAFYKQLYVVTSQD